MSYLPSFTATTLLTIRRRDVVTTGTTTTGTEGLHSDVDTATIITNNTTIICIMLCLLIGTRNIITTGTVTINTGTNDTITATTTCVPHKTLFTVDHRSCLRYQFVQFGP